MTHSRRCNRRLYALGLAVLLVGAGSGVAQVSPDSPIRATAAEDNLPEENSPPPNILLILSDDMGYGDLGCTGSKLIQTPQIDRLAAEGVFCTQGYVASAVCSPSRAGLLTGRDPRRFGYESNLGNPDRYPTRPDLAGLPPTEHTLADHLKAAGYATAIVGKWHLGTSATFHPNRRGFDHFCGMLGGGHGYFPKPDKNHLERNGQPLREFSSPYLTDFFTDEAERWIRGRRAAQPEQPWFLFLSYNAPHTPMHATEEDLAACQHIATKRRRIYAAMMRALDRGIGRVLTLLDELGARENTLIVFFSDNGGATINASWNGPLSGAKGCLREGGVRVPTIWSWTGRIPAARKHHGPVSSLDLLPTFLAAAGAAPLPLKEAPRYEDARNRKRSIERWGAYDGVNLLPVLAGEREAQPRTLFWRLQGQAAVLHGEDKLIRLSHRPAQLFQPGRDIAEADDRADREAELLGALFALLAKWESGLATVPLFGSSPSWSANSAQIYDTWKPRPEPE